MKDGLWIAVVVVVGMLAAMAFGVMVTATQLDDRIKSERIFTLKAVPYHCHKKKVTP